MPVISFDVFDTAIIRKVYKPKDIFNLVEEKVGKDFKKKRIQAEIEARKLKHECNIDDIYALLPEFNKQLEIDFELKECAPNPEIKTLYDDYINQGCTVAFISDMYLGKEPIKNMLKKCGYTAINVFVSCDYGVGKGEGKLFKIVESKIGKIDLHYGDNYNSDIKGAATANIKSSFITALHDKQTSISDIANSKLKKLLVQNEHSDKCIEEKIGYYFGPMLHQFTNWVLDTAAYNANIYFNARDGYLPYKICTEIFEINEKVHYMYSSRRSTMIASLDTSKNLDDITNLYQYNFLRYHRVNTIKDFLKSIGIINKEDKYLYDLSEVYQKLDISEDLNIKPFTGNQSVFEAFLLEIQSTIYDLAEIKKKNVLTYLTNIGIRQKESIFVDIGYFGTIQRALEIISNSKFKGLYFQVLEGTHDKSLSSLNRQSFLSKDLARGYGGLLEAIFTAPEGGVYDYTENGKPLLYNDNAERLRFTEKIHKGVLDCCKDLHKEDIDVSLEDCEILLERFIKQPTIEEAKFGNNQIFENGSNECLESITWFHPQKINNGQLMECYYRSYWREGFKTLIKNHKTLNHLTSMLPEPALTRLINNTNVKDILNSLETANNRFYIYGCGSFAKAILDKYPLILENRHFKGFIDRNWSSIKVFNGKRVYSPKQIHLSSAMIYSTILNINETYNDIHPSMRHKVVKLASM